MRTPTKRRLASALLVVLLALGCVACGPEDGRARGGGPGADGGNKPAQVQPKSKVFNGQSP
ncbi:MAG TPA: hypothetical protein VGJ87_18405 [Roseiflexaceae bacterium]